MQMQNDIRRMRTDEIETVVRLSLAAWAPVFASFERVLGATIYRRLYPDWQTRQRQTVEEVCATSEVWVAEVEGKIAGFIAIALDIDEGVAAERVGEVALLAVDPDYQNRGVGTGLNEFALARMKGAGMRLAVAATGGDPGHAPARRSYEKAGYTPLPLVRYYKAL